MCRSDRRDSPVVMPTGDNREAAHRSICAKEQNSRFFCLFSSDFFFQVLSQNNKKKKKMRLLHCIVFFFHIAKKKKEACFMNIHDERKKT